MKAALASILTSIKSLMVPVVVTTTATVITSSCIHYYSVKDGIYEKSASNVRYVLEEMINTITIDSIVENGNGGYAYSTNLDEKIDELLAKYSKASSTISEYTGNDKKKEIIKKFIKAEIISQYPDLRSEEEIFQNNTIRENELQGGIKIIRKNSEIDTSNLNNNELEYEISEDDQILTYIPYEEFNSKILNNVSDVTKYFSLKSSDNKVDVVVAGWTKVEKTVETIQYVPNSDGSGDQKVEKEPEVTTQYTYNEININYQNSLSKYSMPAGFLWSLLVVGESVAFVENLADLAINNTEIIIEAHDNISTTLDTNVQKYIYKKDITKTIVTKDGTTKSENNQLLAENESTVTTKIETEESKTKLNITYAETWVAIYKMDFRNNLYEVKEVDDNWLQNAEWEDAEDELFTTDTNTSSNPDQDTEYMEMKNKLIEEITVEKCQQSLISKIKSIDNTNSLYYLFNEKSTIYDKYATYIYDCIKGNLEEEERTILKNEINVYISEFWENKSEEAEEFYLENSIEESAVLNELYKLLEVIATDMTTLKLAQTKTDGYTLENKFVGNTQINNTNIYTSAGTKVQERVEIDENNNFITYFNNNTKVKTYILQTTSWLYEMLESHEKTANMIDLFKYLLRQATNGDYGVTTINFNIIDISNFNSMSSIVIGNTVEEKVWFTLKANGISDIAVAGIMGNIYGESGFNPLAVESNGEGIGLCQWSFGRKEQLIRYAESKGTTWQDVDTQIEFLLGEINKNGGANGYAKFQMGVTCYGYTYDNWYNAQDTDTATKAFMAVFERPNMEVAHTSTRCSAAKSYLKDYEGKTMSGGTYVEDGNNGIIGRFTSYITGKTFTIYNQNHSNIGLEGMCHRAVAASIASGYKGSMSETDVINDVKAGDDYILSNVEATEKFFKKYGLNLIKNQYSYSISNMRTMLTQGKYIAIWFNGNSVGKSGSTYSGGTNKIHWIAILGYKNENGTEQIFISDPGWGSSGWKDIDEFETCKSTIVNFHTIYQN